MNRIFKSVIAGSLLLLGATSANAGTINFVNCWSTCSSLGVADGSVIPSVATLEYNDNGSGGVDFILTNTIANMFPLDTSAFLSQLWFNTAIAPTAITNPSANIDSIVAGAFTNAGLQFDVFANFDNKGNPGNLRINNGEFATWTFTGFSEADVLTPAMVHIQATAFNGGSVKVVDGGTIIDNPAGVPEPGILLLLGTGLMGLGLSRKLRAKA